MAYVYPPTFATITNHMWSIINVYPMTKVDLLAASIIVGLVNDKKDKKVGVEFATFSSQ
jgi:hypothetical protein